MSEPAAQAASGCVDDGFSRRVEREAERLRRLTIRLNGTGARSFWTHGVKVELVRTQAHASQAEQAEDGEGQASAQ